MNQKNATLPKYRATQKEKQKFEETTTHKKERAEKLNPKTTDEKIIAQGRSVLNSRGYEKTKNLNIQFLNVPITTRRGAAKKSKSPRNLKKSKSPGNRKKTIAKNSKKKVFKKIIDSESNSSDETAQTIHKNQNPDTKRALNPDSIRENPNFENNTEVSSPNADSPRISERFNTSSIMSIAQFSKSIYAREMSNSFQRLRGNDIANVQFLDIPILTRRAAESITTKSKNESVHESPESESNFRDATLQSTHDSHVSENTNQPLIPDFREENLEFENNFEVPNTVNLEFENNFEVPNTTNFEFENNFEVPNATNLELLNNFEVPNTANLEFVNNLEVPNTTNLEFQNNFEVPNTANLEFLNNFEVPNTTNLEFQNNFKVPNTTNLEFQNSFEVSKTTNDVDLQSISESFNSSSDGDSSERLSMMSVAPFSNTTISDKIPSSIQTLHANVKDMFMKDENLRASNSNEDNFHEINKFSITSNEHLYESLTQEQPILTPKLQESDSDMDIDESEYGNASIAEMSVAYEVPVLQELQGNSSDTDMIISEKNSIAESYMQTQSTETFGNLSFMQTSNTHLCSISQDQNNERGIIFNVKNSNVEEQMIHLLLSLTLPSKNYNPDRPSEIRIASCKQIPAQMANHIDFYQTQRPISIELAQRCIQSQAVLSLPSVQDHTVESEICITTGITSDIEDKKAIDNENGKAIDNENGRVETMENTKLYNDSDSIHREISSPLQSVDPANVPFKIEITPNFKRRKVMISQSYIEDPSMPLEYNLLSKDLRESESEDVSYGSTSNAESVTESVEETVEESVRSFENEMTNHQYQNDADDAGKEKSEDMVVSDTSYNSSVSKIDEELPKAVDAVSNIDEINTDFKNEHTEKIQENDLKLSKPEYQSTDLTVTEGIPTSFVERDNGMNVFCVPSMKNLERNLLQQTVLQHAVKENCHPSSPVYYAVSRVTESEIYKHCNKCKQRQKRRDTVRVESTISRSSTIHNFSTLIQTEVHESQNSILGTKSGSESSDNYHFKERSFRSRFCTKVNLADSNYHMPYNLRQTRADRNTRENAFKLRAPRDSSQSRTDITGEPEKFHSGSTQNSNPGTNYITDTMASNSRQYGLVSNMESNYFRTLKDKNSHQSSIDSRDDLYDFRVQKSDSNVRTRSGSMWTNMFEQYECDSVRAPSDFAAESDRNSYTENEIRHNNEERLSKRKRSDHANTTLEDTTSRRIKLPFTQTQVGPNNFSSRLSSAADYKKNFMKKCLFDRSQDARDFTRSKLTTCIKENVDKKLPDIPTGNSGTQNFDTTKSHTSSEEGYEGTSVRELLTRINCNVFASK